MIVVSVTSISAAPSVRFAVTARAIADGARSLGLTVPSFRTPPRVAGATRTILRRSETAMVAVAVKGRTFGAVTADLIEGVVVANGLSGSAAGEVRDQLWSWAQPHADVGGAAAA